MLIPIVIYVGALLVHCVATVGLAAYLSFQRAVRYRWLWPFAAFLLPLVNHILVQIGRVRSPGVVGWGLRIVAVVVVTTAVALGACDWVTQTPLAVTIQTNLVMMCSTDGVLPIGAFVQVPGGMSYGPLSISRAALVVAAFSSAFAGTCFRGAWWKMPCFLIAGFALSVLLDALWLARYIHLEIVHGLSHPAFATWNDMRFIISQNVAILIMLWISLAMAWLSREREL